MKVTMRIIICLCLACLLCLSFTAGAYSQAGTVPDDLPDREHPYSYTPALTTRLDLLAAQWMMDENNRALCTVFLALDLVMDKQDMFAAHPMYVYESRIGKTEDTIRVIIRSQDRELAYIILYDSVSQTAQFYTELWNEETLAAFEQACTDQFFVNEAETLESAYSYAIEVIELLLGDSD